MIDYHKKIVDYLLFYPTRWKKIDEIRVSLCVKQPERFNQAWKDLLANGRIESIGNEIRINQ